MELCLGTVQLGMDYGIHNSGMPCANESLNILNEAYNNGIHVFDTAVAYGDAERLIGIFSEDKDDIRIVSKIGKKVFSNQYDNYDYSSILRKEIEKSLLRLNKQGIYAYLFHDADLLHDSRYINALTKIKDEGYCDNIGVSVYTPEEALYILNCSEIDILQIPFNILDNRWDDFEVFKKANERNITIWTRSVLLQGLLTLDTDRLPSYMRFAVPVLKSFHALCSKYSIAPFNAAVGYVYAHELIDYVVFGVDSTEQLQDYLYRNSCVSAQFIDEAKRLFSNVDERILNPSRWKE